MRRILVPALAVLLIGADDTVATDSVPPAFDNPAHSKPARSLKSIEDAAPEKGINVPVEDAQSCRDQIVLAEGEDGRTMPLKRKPASPEKPLMIYAVDMQQDGCSFMLMKDGSNEIRPLPLPSEEPLRVVPANAGQ